MTIEANAKVNLTLEVLGKRPDGYHDLRSLVAPISLADTLDIEPTSDGSIASDTGYPDDLCVKAAQVLKVGAKIRVTKRIPVGGGLGGGSADAAAVLRALNDLWQLGKTPEELAAIGAEVGSDVPALVLAQHYRCPVLMEGRGERVKRVEIGQMGRMGQIGLSLACPGVSSSTKEVYSALRLRPSPSPFPSSPTAAAISALQAGDFDRLAASLSNDLQDAAVRLHPEIGREIEALRANGVGGVLMSGSGSCVFALVRRPVPGSFRLLFEGV